MQCTVLRTGQHGQNLVRFLLSTTESGLGDSQANQS